MNETENSCANCNQPVIKFHYKITTDFYSRGLCNNCECEVIKQGFWTPERIKFHLDEREKYKRNASIV